MLNSKQFWTLNVLGLAALVLVIANMVAFSHNRDAQVDVNTRGAYIQQAAQLQPLYQQIIKALADLSVRNNDPQLREVLAKQGISVSTTPPPAAQPPAPAAQPKK